MAEIGLYEAMRTTRAVRRLRPDPIPDEVLRRVLEAATWAPSGGNAQPWRIVVVRDTAAKRRLRDLYLPEWQRFSQGYAASFASLALEARAKQERGLRAATHLAESFHLAPAILIFCFDPRRMAITDAGLGRPSVVGGASLYPAVENALLACRAEGLGCTLTTLLCYREAEVKELLEIPAEWGIGAAVPIGYPESRGHGPVHRRGVEQMAYAERWGQAFA